MDSQKNIDTRETSSATGYDQEWTGWLRHLIGGGRTNGLIPKW